MNEKFVATPDPERTIRYVEQGEPETYGARFVDLAQKAASASVAAREAHRLAGHAAPQASKPSAGTTPVQPAENKESKS